MTDQPEHTDHDGLAGGWGSLRGIAETLGREMSAVGALDTLRQQNKTGGFMCVSCAWGKPKHPHAFEFCENGAKATLWELTTRRCTPDFFASHTVSELRGWRDHDLEQQGRLTHPLRYSPFRCSRDWRSTCCRRCWAAATWPSPDSPPTDDGATCSVARS